MLLKDLVGSWNQKRGCTESGPGECNPCQSCSEEGWQGDVPVTPPVSSVVQTEMLIG